MDDPIAFVEFDYGVERAVYEVDGHQSVIDDKGRPVFSEWYVEPEETPSPIIVSAGTSEDF